MLTSRLAELDTGMRAKVAETLGIGQQTLYHWRIGRSTPRLYTALLLSRILGIPPEAWLRPEQKRTLARAHTEGKRDPNGYKNVSNG